MMKCGIMTISSIGMNYGNKLQNYALQEVIKGYGFHVETVRYIPTYEAESLLNAKLASKSLRSYKERLYKSGSKIIRVLYLPRNRFMKRIKRKMFDDFEHTRIEFSKETYEISSDFSQIAEKYDYVVSGSDQIWNPYWEGSNPVYFLGFMPERKRVVYAASFGVSEIPVDKKETYSLYISSIPFVSCRENRGVEIVRELTGRDVPQVLDPVFMLDISEWIKIEKKPKQISGKQKYILSYFLGGYTHEAKKIIDKYQKEYRLSVVYLDKKDKLKTIFGSPEEFIYLVRNAELVCTDSFHGVAFSILFNVPYICFQRTLDNGYDQNMSSRLASLFQLFGCSSRLTEAISGNAMQMDFTEINKVIQSKRIESDQYLRNALGIEKELNRF